MLMSAVDVVSGFTYTDVDAGISLLRRDKFASRPVLSQVGVHCASAGVSGKMND